MPIRENEQNKMICNNITNAVVVFVAVFSCLCVSGLRAYTHRICVRIYMR